MFYEMIQLYPMDSIRACDSDFLNSLDRLSKSCAQIEQTHWGTGTYTYLPKFIT